MRVKASSRVSLVAGSAPQTQHGLRGAGGAGGVWVSFQFCLCPVHVFRFVFVYSCCDCLLVAHTSLLLLFSSPPPQHPLVCFASSPCSIASCRSACGRCSGPSWLLSKAARPLLIPSLARTRSATPLPRYPISNPTSVPNRRPARMMRSPPG